MEDNNSCGPGTQKQLRVCVDGSINKCQGSDMIQSVPCMIDCTGKHANINQ